VADGVVSSVSKFLATHSDYNKVLLICI